MIAIESPVGRLVVAESNGKISRLYLPGNPVDFVPGESPLLLAAARQLEEYFSGKRRKFDLPLHWEGTPFQVAVWQKLCEIPYGKTAAYSEIANAVGRPAACRAVGAANNRNLLPILIPCHRVIGKSGKLVGYGGGLAVKELLLKIEADHCQSDRVK